MARPSKQQLVHRATHASPASVPPSTPSDLSPEAKIEYERVVTLSRPGALSALDQTILKQYAILAARLTTDPDNFKAAEHTQLRLICAELGLTPASRAKAPEEKPPVDSRWAQFS